MDQKSATSRSSLMVDVLMLALAVISIGLLVLEAFWPDILFEAKFQSWLFIRIDWAICVVFFIEFTSRLLRAKHKRRFVFHNWYDILGMIPFSHPAVRSFRLLRLVRIVATLVRLKRGLDRVFGEGYAVEIVRRYKNILVEVLTDAVVLRVLKIVEEVIVKGRFGESIEPVLERNRRDIRQVVRQNLQKSQTLKRFERLPWMTNITDSVLDEATEVVFGVLTDPVFERVLKDVIQSVMASIHQEVARLEAAGLPSDLQPNPERNQ